MAESGNQIGILFGVAGGASVSGESGQQIAKQLQDLGKHLKVEVTGKLNIAETKKQLNEELKKLTLNFDLSDNGSNSKKTTKNFDSIIQKVNQAKVQLEGLGESFTNKLNAHDSSLDVSKFKDSIKKIGEEYSVLFDENGKAFINENNIKQAENYLQAVKNIRTESQLIGNLNKNNVSKGSYGLSSAKLANNTSSYLQKYGYTLRSNATNEYYQLKQLFDELNSGGYNGRESVAKKKLEELQIAAREAGGEVETVGQKIRNTFGEKLYYGLMAIGALYARQALQQIYQNVVDIDTAMTELKKVTDETDIAYSNFLDNATERAQKLGATVADTVTATADYSRLGYDMDEASELADASIVYKNVGDGITDISEASESIISTLKAFNIDAKDAMTVVDRFNEVGNNFAISSQGVGEILLRSASAMVSANNTLDETIALGSAANEIVQSPEKVGNSLKTISMYLRSSKTDLEDAGESVEGLVESTPQLQSLLKGIAGVDILQSDGQTFKSTYQILQELSKVWDTLTDVNKATVLEAIGGKRNANITSAIITNFAKAEEILKTSANSSGSALAENEKYLDSINGKIAQLKSTFESVSLNFLDSETAKGFIDTLNKLLQTVEKITSSKYGTTALVSGLVGGIGLTSNKTSVGIKPDQLGSTLSQIYKDLSIVHEYNKAVKDGSAPLELQNRLLDETSERMQELAVDVNGAKVSFGAYNKSLISSSISLVGNTVKTIALQAATTALNAAISMGISLLIQLAVTGIQKFIEWIPTTEHLAEKLSTVNDELQTLKSEAETLNDELQTVKDRIVELEAQDSLTLVEDNELTKLKQSVAEYERLEVLKQDEINRKVDEQKTATKKYVEKLDIDNITDMVAQKNYIQAWYDGWFERWQDAKKQYESGEMSYSEYSKINSEWVNSTNAGKSQTLISNLKKTELGEYLNALATFSDNTLSSYYTDALSNLEEYLNKEGGINDQIQAIYDTGYVYGSDEDMDGYLDQLNEIRDLYQVYAGEYDSLWENLLGRGQFDEARNALEGLGDNLTADSLKGLMESNNAVAEFISYISRLGLINWKNILGDEAFTKADKDSNGYLDTTEMLTLGQDELAKGLSGTANQFKNVADETEKATAEVSDFISKTKSLTESFSDISGKKDSIADMLAELRDDGSLSANSMSTLFDDFSGVEGFEDYIKILTSSKSFISQQKQALNDLYGAYIDSKGILDDVTAETYDYAVAQLKALGVTNVTDLATAGLLNTLISTAGATGELNAETETIIKNKLLESGATKQVANDYINTAKQVVQAQYNMTQALSTQTKSRIKNIGVEMSAIQSYEELYLALRKKATASGDSARWSAYVNQGNENESLKAIYGDFAGQYNALKTMYGKDFADEMWEYYLRSDAASKAKAELDKILSQVNNGSLTNYVYDVSVSPTDKSSSSTDKYKQEFEDWYSKLKYLRDTNQKSEEQYLKELDVKNKAYFGNKTEYLEEYAKYSQEVYEGFKKLYQDDLNAQKEALEEQKDQLKELADARKEALDDAKDEEDYNKEQSEKREEINKLKVLIASFRGTLSLSSQKKLRELQQELAEKEEELAEFESGKALEKAKEDIDKEYENQEAQINTKIENIESLLEKVSDDLPEIRNAVISFAKKYGVTITSAYATGTNSSIGGLALTQERGSELIAANVKSGNFTMLTPNSKVWNASATQALYDFANSPEAFIGGIMDKISAFKNKAMSMFYSQPVNVTVGGVTVNGNADTKTVQQIKQGQREQVERMLKEFKKLQ